MLNIIIDNLSRLENFGQYISSVIQIGVILFWIFLTRSSKNGYKISIIISFLLLMLSIVALAMGLNSLAKIIGEYAFLFLGTGILQIVFTKQDKMDE